MSTARLASPHLHTAIGLLNRPAARRLQEEGEWSKQGRIQRRLVVDVQLNPGSSGPCSPASSQWSAGCLSVNMTLAPSLLTAPSEAH